MIHISPKVKVRSNYNVSKEDLPPQLIRSNCAETRLSLRGRSTEAKS